MYYSKPKCLSLFILLLYYYQCVAFFPHALSRQTTKIVGHDWLWRNGFITTTTHTVYTLPVYHSTMSIYARTEREIEFLLAKQLFLAYFFYGMKYHRKEPHTYLFIRHYIYRKQWKCFSKRNFFKELPPIDSFTKLVIYLLPTTYIVLYLPSS